jgi:hypothetical protein
VSDRRRAVAAKEGQVMKAIVAASLGLLVVGAPAAHAACSTARLAGAWNVSASLAPGFCRVTFAPDGSVPSTRCTNAQGRPGATVSGRVSLNAQCKLTGTVSFNGVRFAVAGRTDAAPNLFSGIGTAPGANFTLWASRL